MERDLTGTFWSWVRPAVGEKWQNHPRHAQRPAQLPLLAHGDVVCLQPRLQGVLPLLQLLRAVSLAFLRRRDASEALLHFTVPLLQYFDLLDSVAHDKWYVHLFILWECCEDNAAKERRWCKFLFLTEDWEAASEVLEVRAHYISLTQVLRQYPVPSIFLWKACCSTLKILKTWGSAGNCWSWFWNFSRHYQAEH